MVVVADIDVSTSEGPVLSFENGAADIRWLIRHLERTGVTKAVCESTGGYERPVGGKLKETALSVQMAHPLRVRSFARACGYEAKTDPLTPRYCLATAWCSLTRTPQDRTQSRNTRSCANRWAGESSLWMTVCGNSIGWTRGLRKR